MKIGLKSPIEPDSFIKIKHEIKDIFVHYQNAAELVKRLKYYPEKNTAEVQI